MNDSKNNNAFLENPQEQKIIPEHAKKIALAKMDLMQQWFEFRKKSNNKFKADYEFVQFYNTSNSNIFSILGKISRGTLHRWKAKLGDSEDYTKLIPQYKYSSVNEFRTSLTDEEIKIFMGLLLHPNRISIGKAISLTKYNLSQKGQSFVPSDITFRRYAKWFKDNNYDQWVLMRDGEKSLADKVEPYIKRDASLLEVGDILVADGHKLNFQVINPFTGKPCRATLVGFLDWKSTALVGYEIMLEENTQCIASALRNAIINLDMIPKVIYQDNGRAFRAKYFTDDKGFNELGFNGLYSKLGIQTVFARPYNARAKVIERFFKEFQEGFERLLPSFTGSSIQNKPAYLMRNEKFHKRIASRGWRSENHTFPTATPFNASNQDAMPNYFIPTIEETIKMIDMWLSFKNSQPCSNANEKTIQEVLDERKRQNVDLNLLDDLMLATEVKTIQRNGIRFLGCDYFDERLYGYKSKVLIKYNMFDLTQIKVFTVKGEYLYTAERVTEAHPMAKILGTVEDLEDFKQKIEKQKALKRRTINSVKKYLPTEDIKFLEMQLSHHPEFISESHDCEALKQVQHDGFTGGAEALLPPLKEERKINGKPIFKNNFEKYEWLVQNEPDNTWIQEFKNTKEYKIYYNETSEWDKNGVFNPRTSKLKRAERSYE
ncbi:MAG: transposase [Candidatus Gastranaerophilales bacterium]|nr:transposase [Candidatus Gastranaerophilales bacterium]